MSKILDFPRVIAYVVKDVFHHEEPKVVQLSDYQKDNKTRDEELDQLSAYPKRTPSQILEEENDEDEDEILDEGNYRDSRSNADKAIYFSSFISF